MGKFEDRLKTQKGCAEKYRADAKRKELHDFRKSEQKAMQMIRYHRTAKGVTLEALFATIDTNKDDKVSEDEFKAFFETCEKEPLARPKMMHIPIANKKKTEEDGEAKQEEKKDEGPEKTQAPPAEDLAKLFASWDEDGGGAIPKERFLAYCRVYMKVVADTVITEGSEVKEAKQIRRLEVTELVEIIEGPMDVNLDDDKKVERVRVKVAKDGLEGWCTIAGTGGTKYFKEGGYMWKVKQDTILTHAFELDLEAKEGEDSVEKKLDSATIRKVKANELLEIREWPKKDDKGLTRMRCKVLTDGLLGWVTTISNAGTVFVEATN